MENIILYIGNKNYSSWSLRAWLALKWTHIPFKEIRIPLFQEHSRKQVLEISPSGKLPCLHHNDLMIWDSLAIIEYINEIAPTKYLLPKDRRLRALARSAMAEMHSGFLSLRAECPMNMKRKRAKFISKNATQDLERIYQLWDFCKQASGNGEFLLGEFSAVDVVFTPIVSRIISYDLDSNHHSTYIQKISTGAYYQEWHNAAYQETEILDFIEKA